jgi:DNA-binding transcriptional LysR family regulator
MNDQQMRSFISVAKHKSISKAAEELNISQQGLSRVISVLENELGAKLFARTGGGVELTDSGSMILPAVASMLKSYEEYMTIINVILEKRKETITITHEHASSLMQTPFNVASQLEGINFKMLIAGSLDTCIAQVFNGAVDIAFCHNNDNFGDLEYIPVINEPVTVFMSRDHGLAGKNELVPVNLKGILQLFPNIAPMPRDAIHYFDFCRENGFSSVEIKPNDPDILIAAVRDKTSVVLGAKRMFPHLPDDILGIPLIHEAAKIEMGFLVKSPAKKSVLSFIETAKKCYCEQDVGAELGRGP